MISKDLKPIGVKLPTLPVDERNRRNIFMIDLFPPASGPPPVVYDPAYQAVLDYATLQGFALPSVPIQDAQNQLVVDLKAANAWTEFDVFYNFLSDGDIDFASINWITPGSFTVGQPTVFLKPVYTPLVGFVFSPNKFLNTFWVAGVDGVKYQTADASVLVDGECDSLGGVFTGAQDSPVQSGIVFDGYSLTSYINTDLSSSGAQSEVVPSVGFFHGSTIPATTQLYIDGQPGLYPFLNPVTGPITFSSMYIGARNSGGTFDATFNAGTIRMVAYASALTGKELAVYNAWNTYKAPLLADYAYKKVIDYATLQGYTLPSLEVQKRQRDLIYAFIKDNVWGELDLFYNYLGDGDTDFASINQANPGTYQLPSVSSTLIPNVGIMFNALTPTTYLPDGSGRYQQDRASLIIDATSNGVAGPTFTSLVNDNLEVSFAPAVTFHAQWALNDQTLKDTNLGTFTNGRYLLHFQRANVDYSALWRNGAMVNTYNDLSTGLPTVGLIYSPSSTVHRMLAAGGALVGKELAFNTDWQNYVGWFPG
jgi:hypothetical protein